MLSLGSQQHCFIANRHPGDAVTSTAVWSIDTRPAIRRFFASDQNMAARLESKRLSPSA